METNYWRILLVDDDEEDYLITRALLSEARGSRFILEWARTYDEGLQGILTNEYEAALVDYRLAESSGVDLIRDAVQHGCSTPLILYTGQGNFEVDAQGLKAGAADYLAKAEITPALLERSIRYAIEHKRQESALRNSEEKLRRIVENSVDGIILVDSEGKVITWNPAMAKITGISSEDATGKELWDLQQSMIGSAARSPEVARRIREMTMEMLRTGVVADEIRIRKIVQVGSSRERQLHTVVFPVKTEKGFWLGSVSRDISDLEQARAEAERLASFPRENPYPILRVSPDGFILYANPPSQELLQSWRSGVGQRIPEKYLPVLNQVLLTGEKQTVEVTVETAVFSCTFAPNTDRHYVNLYLADVTDLKATESSLRDSEQRFRRMGEAVPYGVWFANERGDIEYASQSFLDLLGLDLAAVREGKWRLRLDPNAAADVDRAWLVSASTGQDLDVEYNLLGADRNWHAVLARGKPIMEADGTITGWVGIHLDLDERKQLEMEQQNSAIHLELQRRLMQQRDEERIEIARDLHDGPLQELIASSFELATAVKIDDRDERMKRMTWVQGMLQKQIQSLRSYCNNLRPPALTPFGLETAIRSHIDQMRERFPNIHYRLNLMADGQLLPKEQRMALFRMYQELLNNIHRHASATTVGVYLSVMEDEVVLEVQDDGIGFGVPQQWMDLARDGHLGLIGIRERAEAIGAEVRMQSEPGVGTTVRIRLPLKGQPPASPRRERERTQSMFH